MIEAPALILFFLASRTRGTLYGPVFSFVGLVLTILALRDLPSTWSSLSFATLAVILFWFAQSMKISFTSLRTLVVFIGGLITAFFLLHGIFPFWGAKGVTGEWRGLDLKPGSIASLQTSHEKALEIYMGHFPTRDERYFRVATLSETENGIDYHIGARMPIRTEKFPQTRIWVRHNLRSLDLDENVRNVQSWWAKGFRYTLNPGKLESSRPLDEFLFDKKAGFCEHYAASLATILKLRGFDARVAVGFSGGEWNPFTRRLIYEMADSHAWVEAFDPVAQHWSRIDPTLWVNPEEEKTTTNFNEYWVVGLAGLFLVGYAFWRWRRSDPVLNFLTELGVWEKKRGLKEAQLTVRERILRLSETTPKQREVLSTVLHEYETYRFGRLPAHDTQKSFVKSVRRWKWNRFFKFI